MNEVSKEGIFDVRAIEWYSRGYDVYNVQVMLANLGFMTLAQCDGIYGKQTEKAVMSFQTKYMLSTEYEANTVDGIVGKDTKDCLWRKWKAWYESKSNPDDVLLTFFPNG